MADTGHLANLTAYFPMSGLETYQIAYFIFGILIIAYTTAAFALLLNLIGAHMNSKNLSVRMDRNTGELWLTEEKYAQPIRRVKNITSQVLLSLCADLTSEGNHSSVVRDVKFNDGTGIRVTVELIDNFDTEAQAA